MEQTTDFFRTAGIERVKTTVTKCDCGNTQLRHDRQADCGYICCEKCDAVYQVMAVRVNIPQDELDFVKRLFK